MSLAVLFAIGAFAAIVVPLAIVIFILRSLGRKAAAAGYPTWRAYLRAVPRNDEEKKYAVDLTLKGLVLCTVGFFFPPLILAGVVPFYYGARKLCLVWMGVDILDEADRSPV
jgi:hypothetical protein